MRVQVQGITDDTQEPKLDSFINVMDSSIVGSAIIIVQDDDQCAAIRLDQDGITKLLQACLEFFVSEDK